MVVNAQGPNSYNDEQLPYFKMGIYKSAWNDSVTWSQPTNVTSRVVYHDEFRMAGGQSLYAAVAPSQGAMVKPAPPVLLTLE
jgi:hypothetical protein